MPVIGLHHACATVKDLDKSIEFYTETLGMECLGVQLMPPELIYDLYGLQGVSARYCWMRTGSQGVLELMEFDPGDMAPFQFAPNKIGIHHISLQVKNLEETYREALTAGAKSVSHPKDIGNGCRAAYIEDPDGLVVELIDIGLFLTPRIGVLGKIFGFFGKMKKRRAGQMAPGACRTGTEK